MMKAKTFLIALAILAIIGTLTVIFVITRISQAISNRPTVCEVPPNTQALVQFTDEDQLVHQLGLTNFEDAQTGMNWSVLYQTKVGNNWDQNQTLNPAMTFQKPNKYADMTVVAKGHTLRVTYPRSGSCRLTPIY